MEVYMQSFFKSDKYLEELVARFLDSSFYRIAFPEKKYILSRVQNKDLQIKGIDVAVINTENKSVTYIDEKCAAHYINSDLKTFAFEITGTGGNPGWLIKDNMLTDYYLLIWVHADENKYPMVDRGPTQYYEKVQIDEIDYITCCLIEKERIINYLAEKGLDTTSLFEQAKMMREKKSPDDQKNGYKFTYSYQKYKEGPVNILIPKEELQVLATIETDKTDKTNKQACYYYKVAAPYSEYIDLQTELPQN